MSYTFSRILADVIVAMRIRHTMMWHAVFTIRIRPNWSNMISYAERTTNCLETIPNHAENLRLIRVSLVSTVI